MSTQQDGWPRTLAELSSFGSASASSKPAKPPKLPKPKISFSEDTDTAIRNEFKSAGLPARAAEAFLEMIPGLLASDRDIAGDYDANMTGFYKVLVRDRGATTRIQNARKALAEALDNLSETKSWPPKLVDEFGAHVEAIRRTLRMLDGIARSLKADRRRHPKRDMYRDLALESIAWCFVYFGLRRSTAPDSLYRAVAEILLDRDIHNRDLLRAIKAAEAGKR